MIKIEVDFLRLSVSILSADFENIKSRLQALVRGGADMVHIDMMDGQFVPELSFGPSIMLAVQRACPLPLDVHLMVNTPEKQIAKCIAAGASILTLHAEAGGDIARTLEKIRNAGVTPALAINPKTSLSEIYSYLPLCGMALIMTVEAGYGGQELIPETLDKVRTLKSYIDTHDLDCKIEVDGGIKLSNIALVREAGADIAVVGSAIFGRDPIENTVQAFLSAMR